MVKPSNSAKHNETALILKKIYLPDPFVRYMASQPFRAAVTVHVVGFWSLFLGNWLNGSLVWSSPRQYDYTFLAVAYDWLVIGLLLPVAFWALAHWYRSLDQGIEKLIHERIIEESCIKKLIAYWKTRRALRSFLWGTRYIIPLLFIKFMWNSFPSWCPPGKTIWFMNPDRTPNLIGFLFLLLWAIVVLVGFSYLIDTMKLAIFHDHLVHQERKKNGSASMGFFPQHPDGAFGYEPLAPSMNWAGILGLFSVVMIVIAITNQVAFTESTRQEWSVPLLIANSLFIFVFFPWAILGPVSPFILMLFRQKREYLFSLRARLAKNLSEMSFHSGEIDGILTEWERVDRGRPYIIKKESLFIIVASVFLTQSIRIFEALLTLTKKTLPM